MTFQTNKGNVPKVDYKICSNMHKFLSQMNNKKITNYFNCHIYTKLVVLIETLEIHSLFFKQLKDFANILLEISYNLRAFSEEKRQETLAKSIAKSNS